MEPYLRQSAPLDEELVGRIRGPVADPLGDADFRRLFVGATLNPARYHRVTSLPRVEVVCGTHVMGLATYDRHGSELRATDLAIAVDGPVAALVVQQLLETIEIVAVATGCRRVLLLPACHLPHGTLIRDGYRPVNEGCAGGWVEKTLRA